MYFQVYTHFNKVCTLIWKRHQQCKHFNLDIFQLTVVLNGFVKDFALF